MPRCIWGMKLAEIGGNLPCHMTPAPSRILLAEDDDRARRLLEHYLRSWGYEVIAAADGLEALAVLTGDDPPPIGLVDWIMPGMEGNEICQRVRARDDQPYIYLILLTAIAEKEAVTVGLQAGADDYLTKPCDLNELRARLNVGERVLSLQNMLASQVAALRNSLDQVRQLKELLPICAWCKRVRDDEDYWHHIDEYVHLQTGTDFTHGICPQCSAAVQGNLRKDAAGGDAPDRRRTDFRIA